MGYNKFTRKDGTILCDLTTDTIIADKLAKGYTAHDRSGNIIVGTYEAEAPVEEWDGSYTVSGGTISFTIDGVSYEAEDGMTWGEWCDSEYNTGGYEASYIVVKNNNWSSCVADSSGSSVSSSDTIINGHTYSMHSSGEPA